jgi:lipopolysaccharide transport system ATP-binding protein
MESVKVPYCGFWQELLLPDTGQMQVHRPGLRISLISLQAGFVPFMSGRENAILSGMLLGATKKEICSRMDDIVAFSELNGFFDEPVNTYSTGMRARLGFSVAYHVDPDVILLDEVLGVGDASFQKKSTAAMKERIKSDKTVVMVSHSAALVREICDRVRLDRRWQDAQAQGTLSVAHRSSETNT